MIDNNRLFRFQDLISRKLFYLRCNNGFDSNGQSFIAMFHNIVDSEREIVDRYTCTKEQFEYFLTKMRAKNITFISLSQLLSGKNVTKDTCIITFDDGFESVYTIALPILKKMKAPFTVYITSSYVDHSHYLDTEQIRLLSKEQLCSIGLHAHNHIPFRGKPEEEVKREFQKCRDFLFELTGIESMHAAFPYGSHYACSRQNVTALKKIDIKSIAMTCPRFLKDRDVAKPYTLPRINMPEILQKGLI